MTDLAQSGDADVFDEAGYLRLNPGLAEAAATGGVETGEAHYIAHGRAEGRAPNDVDPAFYLAAYPDIAKDLGRPAGAADAARHFIGVGRARGYLPHAAAPRPPDGGAVPSPFGGFWTDRANAADLVRARLELGRIGPKEAAFLDRFARDGIVPLDRPIEPDLTRDAGLAVEQAFTGMFPDLRFGRGGAGETAATWTPDLTSQAMAALDPHTISPPIRDLLLCQEVRDALASIFDAPPRLTASRAWLREAAAADRDVSWFAHSLPLQCAAVTFSLEDGEPDVAGTYYIAAWPGSHHWPDLPWAGAHPSWSEARRMGLPDLASELAGRESRVRRLIGERDPAAFAVARGTASIRHVNLIYTVQPPEPPLRQRTLTAWYCPSFVVPCHMEQPPARPREDMIPVVPAAFERPPE